MSAAVEPWAHALGRIPSGLFVVTVKSPEGETGMLASWVQQCSFDPPQVVAAVKKGRYLLDRLRPETPFVVHVIAEGDKTFLKHFGKGFEPGEDAFAGLDVRPGPAPILTGTHAYISCSVVTHFDAGDHVLILGRVTGGEVFTDARPATHVRKNGLNY